MTKLLLIEYDGYFNWQIVNEKDIELFSHGINFLNQILLGNAELYICPEELDEVLECLEHHPNKRQAKHILQVITEWKKQNEKTIGPTS